MASALQNLSSYDESSLPRAEEMSFGIVVAEWNAKITHALYEGCVETLKKQGAQDDNLHTVQVPGSFELPTGARLLLGAKKLDAVICLGCVIKGETSHNEYINQAVSHGLTNLSLTAGKPVIFGVLTPNDEQQALDRAGGRHGNKGVEAATTALRMVALAKSLAKKEERTIGFQ